MHCAIDPFEPIANLYIDEDTYMTRFPRLARLINLHVTRKDKYLYKNLFPRKKDVYLIFYSTYTRLWSLGCSIHYSYILS